MANAVAGQPPTQGSGGMWASMVDFYHGVMAEMRKVTWPDMQQVRSATIAIIIFVLLLAAAISLMDLIFQEILIKALPSLITGGR